MKGNDETSMPVPLHAAPPSSATLVGDEMDQRTRVGSGPLQASPQEASAQLDIESLPTDSLKLDSSRPDEAGASLNPTDKTVDKRRAQRQKANRKRPIIEMIADLPRLADQTEEALASMPGAPSVFQRGHQLVEIVPQLMAPDGQVIETPYISPLNAHRLREWAMTAAKFFKVQEGAQPDEVTPPASLLQMILSRPNYEALPYLRGMTTIPSIYPDGRIISAPGYDPQSGIFYADTGLRLPPLPDHPSDDEIDDAKALIEEVIEDFPFVSDTDRAAAVAAMFTPVLRLTLLKGNVPLVGISAPTPGSGKSLLVDAISVIVTGEQAPRFAPTSSREEERKRLFSIALAGHSMLLIDNVPTDTPLGSPALDAALTAGVIRDRILGHSKTASAPWQTCVFATGNHLSVQGDLGRRTIPIHLDPRMEHPETRSNFKHADLVGWITETRGAILGAILTVVRGYIRAGCPAPTDADGKPLRPLGSFEPWCQYVRNAVLWAKWADPAARQAAMAVEANPELARMAELLDTWHGAYGSDPRTLSEVVKAVEQESASEPEKRLYAAFQNLDRNPSPSGKLNTRSIGEQLKKYKDRILHGFRLEQSSQREAKGYPYRVINTLD